MPWCLEMSGNEWPEPSSAAWDFLESLCLLAEERDPQLGGLFVLQLRRSFAPF